MRGNNPEVFITRSHVSMFLISILRLKGGGGGTARGPLCNDDIMCNGDQMSSFKSNAELAA